MYVGNLDAQITEDMLYSFFAGCGTITSVKIMRHIVTRKSRGFGFVNFARKSDADYAQANFDGRKIIANKLKVCLKEKFNAIDKSANVVVSNLPSDVSVDELEKLCKEYGAVFSVKVLDGEDATNGSKRAFVLFENLQAAQACIEGLNGKSYRDTILVVESSVKNNIIYVRGQVVDNIQGSLSKALSKWGNIDVSNVEVSEDGNTYTASVKFTDEQTARAFELDYKNNKQECKLTR